MHALVLVLSLAACNRESPSPPASSSATGLPAPTAPPALPSAAAPPDPTPAPHGLTCEVEIAGNLQLPPGAPRGDASYYVFVTLGDCLAEGAKVLGWGGNTNGRFFVEVFVPWGSDVSLCAVSMPPPGKPATLYGRTPLLHAEKRGEVEFKGLVVALRPGPPHLFPRPPGH